MSNRTSVIATALLLSACQQHADPGEPAKAPPPTAAAAATPMARPAAEPRPSRASWTGKHNGTLGFDSAQCTLFNGRIIHFVSPAGASDAFPRIDGTEASPGAWVFNILPGASVAEGFSGSGSATSSSARDIVIHGKLLDGPSITSGDIQTVEAEARIACTAVDDLGNF